MVGYVQRSAATWCPALFCVHQMNWMNSHNCCAMTALAFAIITQNLAAKAILPVATHLSIAWSVVCHIFAPT